MTRLSGQSAERPTRDEYEQALSMLRCPYYQREETCDRGCHEEPECQTCEPREGWNGIVAAFEADAAAFQESGPS